jgi:hypothetical protein
MNDDGWRITDKRKRKKEDGKRKNHTAPEKEYGKLKKENENN